MLSNAAFIQIQTTLPPKFIAVMRGDQTQLLGCTMSDGPRWFPYVPRCQMVQDGPLCSKMVPYVPRWSKMIQDLVARFARYTQSVHMTDCAVAQLHPTHSFNALLSLLGHTHSGEKLLCTQWRNATLPSSISPLCAE